MLAWACAVGILGLSAQISCSSRFYYSKNNLRRSEDCNLCYEKECLSLEQERCEYYAEANSILLKDDVDLEGAENAAVRKEVDDLMYDLIDKVTGLSNNMQCIPYVSQYTSCNKENVCLGCKTCGCDPEGKWNCSTMQLCHSQDSPLNIDHRVLVMVIESLIDSEHPKKTKRSVTDNSEDVTKTASTITLNQLSEWIYGVKPLNKQEPSSTDIRTTNFTETVQNTDTATEIATTETEPNSVVSEITTTEGITETRNNGDTDYLAFDEVLRSIAVDTKSYNRSLKPLDNKYNNQTFSIDYMIMDEDNVTSGTSNDDFTYMFNFMQDNDVITESTVEGATKIVIDLLETAGRPGTNVNVTEDYVNYNKDEESNAFENTNDIIEYNALNIMKRDVTGQDKITVPNGVPTATIIVNTTNTTHANNTDDPIDLKEKVLIPLNKIITDKIRELENLKLIKKNLLKFVKDDGEQLEDIGKENDTSNTYFSIYNVAMETGLDIALKRANPVGYDKYMFKLKSDIFEVIRDIIGIQKHRKSEIPDNLKLLMHAMKRYVYKNKFIDKPKKVKLKRTKSFRRQMEHNFGRCNFISFKDCLVQIIEVIDKDMPKSNALSPLSPASRKLMRHIIKSYYVDEFTMPGLRVHDPHYNFTNDLNNIGSKWQEMTANLINGRPFASLYRMKLLHYTLTLDINKMIDALGLINFAHSRRMFHTLDKVSDDMLERINAGLTAIHNKIQIIIRYYSQTLRPPVTITSRAEIKTTAKSIKDPAVTRKKKNQSFIKHIRSLLKTSKKDIAELLHRKVPKSEIVKQLARKKLDEISEKRYNEYEETMKRWQKNLKLTPRTKRSVLDQFRTRIKSIIPTYLKHKVNPRIKENKMNGTAKATRKAGDRKKKRRALKRERKARRITSPKSKKSNVNLTTKTSRLTTRAPTATLKHIN